MLGTEDPREEPAPAAVGLAKIAFVKWNSAFNQDAYGWGDRTVAWQEAITRTHEFNRKLLDKCPTSIRRFS